FVLDHTLAFWTPLDDRLVSSNPAHSYSDGQMGTLDFNGRWSVVKLNIPKENNACRLGMITLDSRRVALFGCDAVSVFSTSGERLFKHQDLRMVFVSAAAAGAYLAAQCNHYRMETSGPSGGILAGTRADRVEVHDVENRTRRMSVSVH